jgi:putative DNA primase/helicase
MTSANWTPPGVCADVAAERGYRRIESQRQLDAYGHLFTPKQQQTPGVLVPVHRLGEPIIATYVLRPDKPRIDEAGKTVKYEWPQGVGLCLDVLPRSRDALADPTVPIWITEGAKKADALTSHLGSSIVAININGVWGWKRKESTGASKPLDDFDVIAWKDREVVLAFDSDVIRKEEVQRAVKALARYLRDQGAKVRVLVLPEDGEKVGVDDALAGGMTAEQLQDYVRDIDVLPHPADSDAGAHDLLHEANLTDAGNAECMALLFGDRFRYCHTRDKWLHWTGDRWAIDEDGAAQRAALGIARARQAAALRVEDVDRKRKVFSWGLTSESNAKRAATLQTAAIFEQFTSTVALYDRHPMLASVQGGTLDLHVGQLRPSKREDYLTMQLGPVYDPAATCPRWMQFLEEVFAGNKELIGYIQRAVGYSLTGDTSEQVLFLLYGLGANGKSVFLEILSLLLGDYAANASFDTFDAGRRSEATNDLAALKGKRLVTVIETEEDRRLAEARVKAVTGQDAISCRFLYGEYFTYRPQFKIWMAMNHKPIIHGTDRGIWRRIRLIPFTQSFDEHADAHLADKLKAELPGILNWALDGLRAWQTSSLGTAKAIEQATEEYRLESDLVGQWLSECTARESSGYLLTKEAIASYREWCKAHGYREPNDRALGRRMVELGFERGRVGSKRDRCYFGLVLDPEGDQYDHSGHDSGETPLSEISSREVYPKPQNNGHIGQVVEPDPPPQTVPKAAPTTTRSHYISQADQLKPHLTKEKIDFVRDKLPMKGPAWARAYMTDTVEGYDAWPPWLRRRVEADEARDAGGEVQS